jgi:hypothetical protein
MSNLLKIEEERGVSMYFKKKEAHLMKSGRDVIYVCVYVKLILLTSLLVHYL